MCFVLAIFGDLRRYIGKGLYLPIPMYFLLGIGPSYIGMGIEFSIPMYRLLKLGSPYIGMALNRASPMYVPKTTHSGYIGIQQKYQIPMYPQKEYIGTPKNQAIPMYLNFPNPSKIPETPQKHLQIYQKKQPALPHTKSSKRISAQIIVRLTRAGVYCEGEQVYSREIIVKDIKSPRIKVKYIKNAKPNSKTQKTKTKNIIAKKLKITY